MFAPSLAKSGCMGVPVQAAPVRRGSARVYQNSLLTQQGCDPFVCGIAALGCAAACVDTFGAACVACLGPAYSACKDCFN
jgi:hypothetical protein